MERDLVIHRRHGSTTRAPPRILRLSNLASRASRHPQRGHAFMMMRGAGIPSGAQQACRAMAPNQRRGEPRGNNTPARFGRFLFREMSERVAACVSV